MAMKKRTQIKDTLAHEIGASIALQRKSASLTQRELSNLAGLGETTISEIEHGQFVPRLAMLYRIANVLSEHGSLVCIEDLVPSRWRDDAPLSTDTRKKPTSAKRKP
jgi:transcriptional regulator with XRE-family HTH domain